MMLYLVKQDFGEQIMRDVCDRAINLNARDGRTPRSYRSCPMRLTSLLRLSGLQYRTSPSKDSLAIALKMRRIVISDR